MIIALKSPTTQMKKRALMKAIGPSGQVYFDPEVFYEKSSPSHVIIIQLKLLNKDVSYKYSYTNAKSDEYKLAAPIEQCKKLVFT